MERLVAYPGVSTYYSEKAQKKLKETQTPWALNEHVLRSNIYIQEEQ
jgi:hypothetical protein